MSDAEPAPPAQINAVGKGKLTAKTASGLQPDPELQLATGEDRFQLRTALGLFAMSPMAWRVAL